MTPPVLSLRRLPAVLALLAVGTQSARAQSPDRRTNVSLGLNVLQYKGDFGSEFWKFDNPRYTPSFGISQYLGKGLDLSTQLAFGKFTGRRSADTYFTTDLVGVNAGFKFKLNNGWALKERSVVQPYLLLSGGWVYTSRSGFYDGFRQEHNQGYFDGFGAAGINFRLGSTVNLFVQTGRHLPLEADFDGMTATNATSLRDQFLQHTVGLSFNMGQLRDEDEDGVPDRKDRCPNTPQGTEVDATGCPRDQDHDGVPDTQDQCPDAAGTAELHGCPDQDHDGVADADDACPEVPGKIDLQGCPDQDNDGIPDRDDKCPDTPADTQVDAEGCPSTTAAPTTTPATEPSAPAAVADQDKDGVPDAEDRCPATAGPAANKGCPEVRAETKARLREATKRISFASGRAVLLPVSYPTLDGLAQLLTEYPDYTLSIVGHTDSKGAAALNQRLSRDRAAAARQYLIGKGVPAGRVELRGYGATHPLTANATEAGRARNRRVEFDLFLTGDVNPAEARYGAEPQASAAPVKKAAPARKPAARKAAAYRKAATKAGVKKAPAAKAAPRRK